MKKKDKGEPCPYCGAPLDGGQVMILCKCIYCNGELGVVGTKNPRLKGVLTKYVPVICPKCKVTERELFGKGAEMTVKKQRTLCPVCNMIRRKFLAGLNRKNKKKT